jgi:hypothetical protein
VFSKHDCYPNNSLYFDDYHTVVNNMVNKSLVIEMTEHRFSIPSYIHSIPRWSQPDNRCNSVRLHSATFWVTQLREPGQWRLLRKLEGECQWHSLECKTFIWATTRYIFLLMDDLSGSCNPFMFVVMKFGFLILTWKNMIRNHLFCISAA